MRIIHVECKPDEALVKRLGFPKKSVKHHSGKSRVFSELREVTNQIAIVDEDPGSPQTTYESNLKLVKDHKTFTLREDSNGNKVITLKVKLEDFILDDCKNSNVNPQKRTLPTTAKDLHGVINGKIDSFQLLVDDLLSHANSATSKLKVVLHEINQSNIKVD